MVKHKSLTPKKRTSLDVIKASKQIDNQSAKKTKVKRRKQYALKEIRHFQKTTHLLIPRLPFLRLIREIMMMNSSSNTGYRITAMAVEALREAAESFLVGTMEDAYQLAIHAKRVTLMPRDIQLLTNLRREFSSRD